MLSYLDYQNKWTSPAPVGFGRMLRDMPSYHEYVIREIYQQDYLDLFLGAITFNRTPLNGGIYFVQITGDLILDKLGIPLDPLYTFSLNGNDYIMVDYKYPWSMAQINQKRYIKYIMIGEAASTSDSYFYKQNSSVSSPWLKAPVSAFTPSPNGSVLLGGTKLDKLLYLADNGYLLIDLFPFATDYSDIRSTLNITGVSPFYFNNDVIFRINHFIVTGLTCKNLHGKNSDGPIVAFSGPPTIHHNLANQIALGAIVLPPTILCMCYINDSNPPTTSPIKLNWYRPWIPMDVLHGNIISYSRIPYYRCCTYHATNPVLGPQEIYIKIAFDL